MGVSKMMMGNRQRRAAWRGVLRRGESTGDPKVLFWSRHSRARGVFFRDERREAAGAANISWLSPCAAAVWRKQLLSAGPVLETTALATDFWLVSWQRGVTHARFSISVSSSASLSTPWHLVGKFSLQKRARNSWL